MKKSEFLRGLRAIDYLANGAPSHQKTELPPVQCKNSATAFEYGRVLTDTVSRARSTTSQDLCLLNSFEKRELPEPFMSWMKNPVENWDLHCAELIVSTR